MSRKIMLIEDDSDTRQALLVRLRANQYDTVWAQDAISAVGIAVNERPGLILLDLGLPGGDGFLVIERLQSMALKTPIIVLSGREPALNRERALRAGAVAFLEKPADNEEILGLIQKHFPGNDVDAHSSDRRKYKIMLVEDDSDTRKGLIVRLKANRYEIAWAQDAISAPEKALNEKPDLILLDLSLPGGDGFMVMERMKAMANAVPIVILSGRDPAVNRERALSLGAVAYLQKPADDEEILATLREHLPGGLSADKN